jgi:hypothetical protein
MKPAKQISELPKLLGGQPVGSTFKIEGYVDSAGTTKDLLVKTLGPNDYASMKQQSLAILEKNVAPELPGFPPVIVAQARDALMTSYRGSGQSNSFKDPYVEAEEGGYSIKPGEPSIYMLRLEDMSERTKVAVDPRVDLVRAKAALVRALELPAGRYMHAIKLTDGKFKSVQKV